MRDWLAEWIERILDFFCLTGTPRELPEDSYAREQEAQHNRDLAEFDSVLRRELKMPVLPWENVVSNYPGRTIHGTFDQLLQPGLGAIFAAQARAGIFDYRLGMLQLQQHQPATYEEAMQMQQQAQMTQQQMNAMMGDMSQMGTLNGILGGLLGSQSRPSRPE